MDAPTSASTVKLSRYGYGYRKGHNKFVPKLEAKVRCDTGIKKTTIHHKISQAHLKRLTLAIEAVANCGGPAQQAAAVALLETLGTYMSTQGIGVGSSVFTLLNNLPLNLAYGPTARLHHMGDKFDPNVDTTSERIDQRAKVYTRDTDFTDKANRPEIRRSLSSRSLHLGKADQAIVGIPTGKLELRKYAASDEATESLKAIHAALKDAIAADKLKEGTSFWDKNQWEKIGNSYLRNHRGSVGDIRPKREARRQPLSGQSLQGTRQAPREMAEVPE